VEVFLTGDELDADGLVADFSMLKDRLGQITGTLEGRRLDELPVFSGCNASTELIARHLCDRYRPTLPPAVRLVKVRVWETEDCAAAYHPGDEGDP
jgi:6-pyruvoyl-tetrahydropterin synthase